MKGDLGESFEKLKSSMHIRYRGALIEIPATPTSPYAWNGMSFSDLWAAREAVDKTINALLSSVIKNK